MSATAVGFNWQDPDLQAYLPEAARVAGFSQWDYFTYLTEHDAEFEKFKIRFLAWKNSRAEAEAGDGKAKAESEPKTKPEGWKINPTFWIWLAAGITSLVFGGVAVFLIVALDADPMTVLLASSLPVMLVLNYALFSTSAGYRRLLRSIGNLLIDAFQGFVIPTLGYLFNAGVALYLGSRITIPAETYAGVREMPLAVSIAITIVFAVVFFGSQFLIPMEYRLRAVILPTLTIIGSVVAFNLAQSLVVGVNKDPSQAVFATAVGLVVGGILFLRREEFNPLGKVFMPVVGLVGGVLGAFVIAVLMPTGWLYRLALIPAAVVLVGIIFPPEEA